MPAEFRIDQVTPGTGIPGRTRHDLVPNEVITLVATSPTGPGITYTWEILDKVGSAATLTSTTGVSTTIGPFNAIVRPSSFRIRLTVNDNGTITTMTRRASVRTLVTGMFVPLFPESAPSGGTLSSNNPDASEDNAVYTNRAGLGVADQNWRGWAEWAYEIVLAVESGGGAGGPPTGPAGGDLGGTYPNPDVIRLRGRMIENVAPNNNDYLRWDSGTVSWRPTAFPSGLPPTGAAGGDLNGNYPNPGVAQVQGFPVQSGTPAVNDIWRFTGVSWDRVAHGNFIDGTEVLPSIYFGSDPGTDTGLYRPAGDTIGFTSGGAFVAKFKRPLVAAAGTQTSFQLVSDVGAISGTAGFNALSMDVQGAPTGSGIQRLVYVTRDGADRYTILETGQHQAVSGSLGAPSYSFLADPTSGLFMQSAGKWDLVAAGVAMIDFASGAITYGERGYHHVGTAALPGVSFNGDPDTGMYWIAANTIGFSTFGTLQLAISTVGIDANLPYRAFTGSAANPHYEFGSDLTTGMFLVAAGVLAFSVSGTEKLRLNATNGLATLNWLPAADLTYNLGDPSFRWNNLWVGGSSTIATGLFGDGTVGAPSIAFAADTDTGFYRVGSGSIGVTADGLQVVRFQAVTGVTPQAIFAGGVGENAPSITFHGDQDTGFWNSAADVLSTTVGGTRRMYINTTEIVGVLPFRAQPNTVGHSFEGAGANTTGIGSPADGSALRLIVLNAITANVTTVGIDPASDLGGYTLGQAAMRWNALYVGTVFADDASYTFTADQDTKISRAGSGIIAMIGDNLEIVRFQAPAGANPQLLAASGSATAPAYGFAADTDTGIYLSGASLGLAFNGTLRYLFTNVGISTAVTNSTWSIGHISTRVRIELNSRLDNAADTGAGVSFLQHAGLAYAGANVAQQHVFASVTVNQTGTSAFDLIRGAVTNTALGSGDQNLLNLTIGGTSVFKIKNSTSAPTQGQVQAIDGASTAPTYSFISDPDTGFYRAGAQSIGIGIDGTRYWMWTTNVLRVYTAGARIGSGTPGGDITISGQQTTLLTPSVQLDNFGSSFSAAGAGQQRLVRFETTVNQVASTAGFTAFEIDITQTSLGSGNQYLANWMLGGTSQFIVTSGTTAPGRVLGVDGALGTPTYSFISDPNTGIRRQGAGAISVDGDGLEVVRIQAPGGASPQLLTNGGTLAAPPYSFIGGASTGMLYLSPELAFSVGGTEVARMQAPAAVPQLLIQAGSAAAPSLAFRLNTDTGFIDTTGLGVSGVGFIADGSLAGAAVNNAGNVQLLAMAGTAAAPGLVVDQFGSGFYSPGGGAITAVSGGTEIFRWDSTPALYLVPNGSAANPILTWDVDPSTGLYLVASKVLGISTGGVLVARFEQAPTLAAGTGTGLDLTVNVAGITGTAGYDAMHIDVTGAAAGSGDKNLLKITEGGADRLHVQQNGRIRGVDGTAALPTYTFLNDPNTGVYSAGADDLGFATGGTLRLDISTTAVTSTLPYLAPDGSAAAPAYRFSAQGDLGFYRSASDTVGFSSAGTLRVTLDKTSVTSTIPFWGANGTAGAPTYSFSGDTDNGLYYVTTNEVGMSAGGGQTMRWTTTATYSALPIEFSAAAIGTPTAGTNRVGTPNTAGRPPFLAANDSNFGDVFLATGFHDRQKFFLLTSGTTTMVNAGFQMGTSGTVAYVTPTGTSFMTACQKNSFVTGAVSGNTADIHSTTGIVSQGNSTTLLGFLFHARFAVGSDYTSNTRLFVGLINSAVTLTGTTNPGALNGNRMVGVGLNSASTTLNVFTNDAGGAPQATSTGLTVAANDAFDVWIWMPPNSTTRHVYVNRINGAAGTYSGSSFNFPPGANQWLQAHSWIATAEAAAKTMYVMRWAIEAGQ